MNRETIRLEYYGWPNEWLTGFRIAQGVGINVRWREEDEVGHGSMSHEIELTNSQARELAEWILEAIE